MGSQRKRNPNGVGTITKCKDGRYQCAVYVLQPDGTRARKFAYGTCGRRGRFGSLTGAATVVGGVGLAPSSG